MAPSYASHIGVFDTGIYEGPAYAVSAEPCSDDPSFTDAQGHSCSSWSGYDCLSYAGYTQAELGQVQSACAASCNLCVYGVPEPIAALISPFYERLFTTTIPISSTGTGSYS